MKLNINLKTNKQNVQNLPKQKQKKANNTIEN